MRLAITLAMFMPLISVAVYELYSAVRRRAQSPTVITDDTL